ncbi:MAG TPA: class E sortase [Acidimicrobiia bacterium]|nr:class E sortase [Acidimicrobiia bacterium]
MIRDRALRTFSVIVLVAGTASLVGAAGAEWDGAPAFHHTSHASSLTTVGADRAQIVAAHASLNGDDPLPVARAQHTRRAARKHVVLPKMLPARYLPVGAQLPVPAAVPNNPWARRAVAQIGTIGIPALRLSSPIFEGVDQAAFAHGPGHWPGTAMPGGWGNAVFGGHRTTQTHPFLDTDRLHAGDEIDFAMLNGWTYVYKVARVFVVGDDALWIKNQGAGRTVTLFTCNPKGSATSRLVTTGVLDRIVATT